MSKITKATAGGRKSGEIKTDITGNSNGGNHHDQHDAHHNRSEIAEKSNINNNPPARRSDMNEKVNKFLVIAAISTAGFFVSAQAKSITAETIKDDTKGYKTEVKRSTKEEDKYQNKEKDFKVMSAVKSINGGVSSEAGFKTDEKCSSGTSVKDANIQKYSEKEEADKNATYTKQPGKEQFSADEKVASKEMKKNVKGAGIQADDMQIKGA